MVIGAVKDWRERRAAEKAEVLRKGEILRRLHWRCWDVSAPQLETPLADLIEVLPVLIESGSVGLVWPRLWHRAEELGAVGAALAAAYDAQVAHNARVERDIARVVTRLREHGVEPVLIKGLAVARLYPSPLVRPAGDIDLVVPEEQYDLTRSLIENDPGISVDLKQESNWLEHPRSDFWSQMRTIDVLGTPVRMLGAEDELRMLCFHFLRHGAMRSIWLLDVAAALEGRPETFAWKHFTSSETVQDNWLATALGLAHHEMGASIAGTSYSASAAALPAWLTPAMYRHWYHPTPMYRSAAFTQFLRTPREFPAIVASRWPEPITATISTESSFQSPCRWPLQARVFRQRFEEHLRLRFGKQFLSIFRPQAPADRESSARGS